MAQLFMLNNLLGVFGVNYLDNKYYFAHCTRVYVCVFFFQTIWHCLELFNLLGTKGCTIRFSHIRLCRCCVNLALLTCRCHVNQLWKGYWLLSCKEKLVGFTISSWRSEDSLQGIDAHKSQPHRRNHPRCNMSFVDVSYLNKWVSSDRWTISFSSGK